MWKKYRKNIQKSYSSKAVGQSPSTPASPEICNPQNNCPCKDYHRSNHWIDCDCCGQWWHSNCISLDEKICNFIVKRKVKFSCPTCIVSKFQCLNIHNPTLVDLTAKTPAKIDSTYKTIDCTPDVQNFFPNTPTLSSESPSCSTGYTNTSDTTTQDNENHACVSKKIYFDNSRPLSNSTKGLNFGNTDTVYPGNHLIPNKSISASIPKTSVQSTTKSNKLQTKLSHQDQQNRFIVIIDGINEPEKFKSSIAIKKEVNKCKPALSFFHCYSLPAGGIAIHCRSKEDLLLALLEWPASAFNYSTDLHVHLPSRSSTNNIIFIKSVNTNLSENTTKEDICNSLDTYCSVTGLYNKTSGLPLPVIKITFEDNEMTQLYLRDGIYILGNRYCCSPKRICKVVRCFNCQQFGHIARLCLDAPHCIQCGKWHFSDESSLSCSNPPSCANCGSSHRADSHFCQKFTSILSDLNQRISFCHDSF